MGSCLLQAFGRQLPGDDFYYEHANTGMTSLRLHPELPLILCYSNRLEHLSATDRT